MLPFRFKHKPGTAISEQVVFAATRAMVSGELRPGDRFPSVRTLAKELHINPNTAKKIVMTLTAMGLLEVEPGIGTLVRKGRLPTREERQAVLEDQVEQLVVEAKRLYLSRDDVVDCIGEHWNNLTRPAVDTKSRS